MFSTVRVPELELRSAYADARLPPDTFIQPILTNPAGIEGNQTYNMTDKGIAWPGEAKKYGRTKYALGEAVPPPYWMDRYPNGYTESFPDLSTDEHFQVWMRTAGLPTFRKLYFRNDDEDMSAGQYSMQIYMSEPAVASSRAATSDSLASLRLPGATVWRNEVGRVQHRLVHRWPEPVPRHRVHCRRWRVRPTRTRAHIEALDPAEEAWRHESSEVRSVWAQSRRHH